MPTAGTPSRAGRRRNWPDGLLGEEAVDLAHRLASSSMPIASTRSSASQEGAATMVMTTHAAPR